MKLAIFNHYFGLLKDSLSDSFYGFVRSGILLKSTQFQNVLLLYRWGINHTSQNPRNRPRLSP